MHRASDKGDGVSREAALSNQIIHDLPIRPSLIVRLLLLRPGAKLDDGGSGISKSQQDLFPVRSLDWHLCLGGKQQIEPEFGIGQSRRACRQEGQLGQPESEERRLPRADLGEFGDFSSAMQHEQVTCGPRCHCSNICRHADSGQAGNEHGSGRSTEQPLGGQRGDNWSGAGQQDDVGTLKANPAYHPGVGEDLRRPAASRLNLCRGGHDRVLDQQLARFPGGGKCLQGCSAPFQV
jgi:hypothetical protein